MKCLFKNSVKSSAQSLSMFIILISLSFSLIEITYSMNQNQLNLKTRLNIKQSENCSITNCLIPDEKCEYCVKCKEDFFTLNDLDSSVLRKDICTRKVDRCLNYEENGLCKTCEEGNSLLSNKNSFTCEPCKTVNEAKTECASCDYQSYHYLILGKCLFVDKCTKFNSTTGLCLGCEINYILDSKQEKCLPKIDHCISQVDVLGEFHCNECEANFIAFNHKCSPKIENCLKHTSIINEFKEEELVCSLCGDLFDLDLNNRCKASYCAKKDKGFCVECQTGYFLSNEKKCEKVISNCDKQENGLCVQCSSNFFLKNFECIPMSLIGCQIYAKDNNLSTKTYNSTNNIEVKDSSSSVSSPIISKETKLRIDPNSSKIKYFRRSSSNINSIVNQNNTDENDDDEDTPIPLQRMTQGSNNLFVNFKDFNNKYLTSFCQKCKEGYVLDNRYGHCYKSQKTKSIKYSNPISIAKEINSPSLTNRKNISSTISTSITSTGINLSQEDEKMGDSIQTNESNKSIGSSSIITEVEEKEIITKKPVQDFTYQNLDISENKSIMNCIDVFDSKCKKCLDGFILNKEGLCVLDNCLIMKNESECYQCRIGFYYFNKTNTCNSCNGYKFYENPYECNICPRNYKISEKITRKKEDNFKDSIQEKNIDTSVIPQKTPVSIPIDEDSENQFNKNIEKEILSQLTALCVKKTFNCKIYNQNDVCFECEAGYLLSSDKKYCFENDKIKSNKCFYMHDNILVRYEYNRISKTCNPPFI